MGYGCVVYGSVWLSYIKLLDTIHHQNVCSWEVVCWRQRAIPWQQQVKLDKHYANKLKFYPSNLAYDCVFHPLYEDVYDEQPNTIQLFGLRVKSHIENSNINLDDIAPIVIPENPSWFNPKPIFNLELTQYKQVYTIPLLIKQHFAEIRLVTSEYYASYADGSKDGDSVASAAVLGLQVYSDRLPSASLIFSALVMKLMQYVLLWSSIPLLIRVNSWSIQIIFLACWQLSCKTFILKIVDIYKSLVAIGKHVILKWILSHMGIHWNTFIDQEANNALDDPVSNCSIPYADFKTFIMKYSWRRWQDSWDLHFHSKLHEIHSLFGKTPCSYGQNRK